MKNLQTRHFVVGFLLGTLIGRQVLRNTVDLVNVLAGRRD